MRPQPFYRQVFRDLVLAERPAKVLEVGSRDGEFLRVLAAAGVRAEGLEIDADRVAAMRAKGLVAHTGAAEQLPFPDASFDLVCSEFSAHHFRDLPRHLAEALRVARRGVFLLDQWYDLTIPSQCVAARWDRWFKAIDRAAGKVHNDVISAEGFRRALPAGCAWSFECQHLLRLVPVDDAYFQRENALFLEHLRGTPQEATEVAELAAIEALRAHEGLSDDGALLMLLRAPETHLGQPGG